MVIASRMKLPLLGRVRRKSQADAERQAFDVLVEQCWDQLWRFAYRMTGNRDDAEDLLSESLVDGFVGFHQFRGNASFSSWMYRVMTSNRIDMQRKARRHQAQSLDEVSGQASIRELTDGDADTNPERALMEPLLSETVQAALDALSEEFRAVVVLADIEEHDYEEISRILGVPIGTVRSRLHRGRAQMRRSLAPIVEQGQALE